MRTTLLLFVPLLLSLVFFVNVNTATQNYVPINVDIDRSNIPKNILFGSFPGGRSHVKPMLDIAAILIERGYNITLVASGENDLSEYSAVKYISLGPRLNLRDVQSHGIQEEMNFGGMSKLLEIGVKFYNGAYKKYKSVAKDYNIDLFICDLMLNEACLDIAHTLKKPVVGFMSSLMITNPKPYKSDPIFGCNISLENESFFERFRCTLIQPLRFVYSLGHATEQLNDMRKQMNVEPGHAIFGKEIKVSLTLVDTFFGFELPQTIPPHIQEIGPILSEEYPSLPLELSNFVNGHERVLYVAFGTRFFTTIKNNSKLLQTFVEAINKKIIDGVIWALVQTSKDDFYPTLELTDGTQVQTSPILNNENPHIRIVKFAPQFAVLNHTNTKLFFSHGGSGSSHESLYTGTPMLVLPLGGDQMGNAQKLKSAGVALSLKITNLDVNDILNKMDSLLNDENVKKNSKRVEVLAKINRKRKFRAADLIEYILHKSSLVEHVNEDFLKEWVPADSRMGFIKGKNLDIYGTILFTVLGFTGFVVYELIRLIRFIIGPSSDSKKGKME